MINPEELSKQLLAVVKQSVSPKSGEKFDAYTATMTICEACSSVILGSLSTLSHFASEQTGQKQSEIFQASLIDLFALMMQDAKVFEDEFEKQETIHN